MGDECYVEIIVNIASQYKRNDLPVALKLLDKIEVRNLNNCNLEENRRSTRVNSGGRVRKFKEIQRWS